MTAVTETVLLSVIAGVVLLVLGVSWLVYLARGGKPFHVSLKGLGIEVTINEPKPRTRGKVLR